ncbi:hypothetical protein G6F37_009209 [Rhizopus arrhizus]|nr:hypothetical protein G6F38_003313 [Rhizopus arrhizus]KAG1154707.1 hypothetical protein G6F37_009209 [Rhizopus arrhizus]
MSEDNDSFGSVFASGIQDVAAVLGILGTEMCDGNAALTLSKGYLFPAACGTSMFGVLGLSKYLLKSFLPDQIVKNMGINRSEFDKYKLKEKVKLKVQNISDGKLSWLQKHDVKIYVNAPAFDNSWWILSLASCFSLSCLNFVPYIPHYYHTPSLDSIYFPLLLTASSFVASYVCCVDSILMLFGSFDLYDIAPIMEFILIPHHFGNKYIVLLTCIIGCISALGIVVGYLGSYLVVQQMAEVDVYLWLGLELVLCSLRLIIWSLNTEKDDIKTIGLRFKVDRTDEKVIEAFQKEFGISKEEAEEMLKKIKEDDCFILFEAVDLYLQIKKYVHVENYDIEPYYEETKLFIKLDKKRNTYEKIAILCDEKGIVLEEDQMNTILLDEYYRENFNWMDLKDIDDIDSCYVQRISEKESKWYLYEELELQPCDKDDFVDEEFMHITYVYKIARAWTEKYDCNELDRLHKSRPGFKDSEKEKFDQVYDVIDL